MAKIVAGGMPGGAVAGRADLMDMVEFRSDPGWNENRRVPQAGTYNGNPLAAAAGLACLTKAEDKAVHDHCDRLAGDIRAGLNRIFVEKGAPAFAWGESSVFHLALGEVPTNLVAGDLRRPEGSATDTLKSSGGTKLAQLFEIGMMLEGVHLFHSGGLTCAVHTDEDVAKTLQAAETVTGRMQAEGLFG